MAVEDEIVSIEGSVERLYALIEERISGRYALFFGINEGEVMPDGTETESGFVIDERGRVFAFWTAWDAARNGVIFESWEEDEPEPHWQESADYQRARVAVGLPVEART